jgi:hypothetical protein
MNYNFTKLSYKTRRIIIITAVIFPIIFLIAYLYYQPPFKIKKEDLRMSAILASHQFIKEKLRAPDKAVFQPADSAEYYIQKGWWDTFHFVVSYFDAESVSGKMIRTHFSMELQKTQTVWIMLDLDTW